METPNTKPGQVTEKIMQMFWQEESGIRLETSAYNRVWSHVFNTLQREYTDDEAAFEKWWKVNSYHAFRLTKEDAWLVWQGAKGTK